MEIVPKSHIAILKLDSFVIEYKNLFPKDTFKKVAFFSDQTINKMVEEESKRDTSIIIEREGQSLRSMSSGERKVALLNYLISLKPVFLFVENFHENLDSKNQSSLEELICKISKKTLIIQVVRKEKELFSFIDQFFYFNERIELKYYDGQLSTFFELKEKNTSEFSIPKTTTKYKYDFDIFVKLRDVTVSFLGKPIFKDISWEIKLGEFWQLIGENG